MGWFSGRIDVHFIVYCLRCGYSYYPYCENWTLGVIPRDVFQIVQQRECPKCGETKWGRNF